MGGEGAHRSVGAPRDVHPARSLLQLNGVRRHGLPWPKRADEADAEAARLQDDVVIEGGGGVAGVVRVEAKGVAGGVSLEGGGGGPEEAAVDGLFVAEELGGGDEVPSGAVWGVRWW
jgi:hypothetical protein